MVTNPKPFDARKDALTKVENPWRISDSMEDGLHVIIQNMPLGFVVWSPDQKILEWNKSAARIFGYSEVEAVGKHISALFPPGNWPQNVVESLLRAQGRTHHQNKIHTRSGRTLICEWYNTALVDAVGNIRAIASIVDDVTYRVQSEESTRALNERFRLIFESSRDAIGYTTLEGHFVDVNQAFTQLTGYSREELYQCRCQDITPPEFAGIETGIIERVMKSGVPVEYEKECLRKDDSRFPVLVSKFIVRGRHGEALGIGEIIKDISERRRAEQEVMRLNADLEKRVTERTAQLHATSEELMRRMEELARSNRDLDAFAAIASHDLQEPLRAIAGFTDLLAERYTGKLDEQTETFMGHARKAVSRMQYLIRDLLAYSRLRGAEKSLERVDSAAALNEALENLSISLKESDALISFNGLPQVMANHSRLVQVFQNLVKNAIQYRSSNVPRVDVFATLQGNEWTFAVRDNGIGIAPEHHDRIFNVFQRLHGPDRSGSGIGLATSKLIVEQFGGKIWVQSSPGAGSTFYFTLPATPAQVHTHN